MRFILLLTFCTLFSISTIAQECCPYIEEVTILPETPTISDEVLVHTVVVTPNQGEFLGYDVEIEGFNINVINCYWQGFATAIQTYTEDVPLGMLPEGDYSLHFVALLTETENDCNAIVDSTVFDTTFTVSGTNAIDIPLFEQIQILNQGDKMTILNAEEVTSFAIYDLRGRVVHSSIHSKQSTIETDISNCNPAIYAIRVRFTDGSTKSMKFTKQ